MVGSAIDKSVEGIGVCLQGNQSVLTSRTSPRPDLNWLDFDVGARIADTTQVRANGRKA
jgi:hypothetical protein